MKNTNLMVLAIVSLLGGCGQDDAADQQAIRQVMLQTWDRPQSRLDAGPIAVSGSHAVADWSQGEMGGRALFEKRGEKWVVTLCGGDALRTDGDLQGFLGVSLVLHHRRLFFDQNYVNGVGHGCPS